MQRALLIYDSKYGSTEAVVKRMALVLGPSRYCRPAEFKEEYRSFELIVIGAPVYHDRLPGAIMDFVAANHIWLRSKRVAFFCTCLNREQGTRLLDGLAGVIGNVRVSRVLGGRLDLQRLDEQDALRIVEFCRRTGTPLHDTDLCDPNDLVNFALELKDLKDDGDRPMPAPPAGAPGRGILDQPQHVHAVHRFGASAFGAPPLEYSYQEGHLYLLSEGGEKFANLLLNPAVSIAIYDPYQGMNRLASLQLSGRATIVDGSSPEYQQALEIKGISPSRIASLPIILNVIKIELEKAEFLHSQLQHLGYDMKQVYYFSASPDRRERRFPLTTPGPR